MTQKSRATSSTLLAASRGLMLPGILIVPLLLSVPPGVMGQESAVPDSQALAGTTESAETALEQERYDEALRIVEQGLSLAPEDPKLLRLRAEILRRSHDLEEAREAYARIVEIEPEDPVSFFWLATVERWLGEREAALVHYDRVLELSPGYVGALTGSARIHLRDGADELAEARLRRALEIDPGNEEATELLADLLAARGDLAAAESLLRQTFRGRDLELRLASALAAAGETRNARDRLYALVETEPENGEAWRRIGELERELGNTRRSLAAYGRAVEIDPGDSNAFYWVGVLSTRLGEYGVAIDAFDALLERNPESVGAMLGKARALHFERRNREALAVLDQALSLDPESREALTLRGRVLSVLGERGSAIESLQEALAADPTFEEARLFFDRLRSERALGGWGRTSESEVVEGIDDEGLIVDGSPIRPTRIRYLTEGGGAFFRTPLGGRTGMEVAVSQKREAVFNQDQDRAIYDFDVTEAGAALDHTFSDRWGLSLLFGGKRYEPRREGTIGEEDRFLADLELTREGPRSTLVLDASRTPFIHRGFAGDLQFEIFTRNHFGLDWARDLPRGAELTASAAVDDYDDGNTEGSGGLGYEWHWKTSSFLLRYRHSPFPARFLTRDNELEFIDLDLFTVNQRTELGRGFAFAFEGNYGYFGETERSVEVDGTRVEGPLDNNTERNVTATLEWNPPGAEVLTVGVDYLWVKFDFDTGPYNTIDVNAWVPWVRLAGEMGLRGSYDLRYSHGFMRTERDPDFDSDEIEGRLELKLGPVRSPHRSPARLSLTGRYREQTLVSPSGERFDEQYPRLEVSLTVPF